MSAGRIALSTEYTYHNRVKLVRGGHDYFEILDEMIRNARESIHLQTYIYEYDTTGKKVAESLFAAAARGVQVYLMVDGYASKGLPETFIRQLETAGIHFRMFEPLLKSRSFYFGRRMHHKLVVTDARYSLVSGVNISDRYNDLPGAPAWLDWALYAEGEVSFELFKLCLGTWYKSMARARPSIERQRVPEFPESWNCAVKVRRNDWVRRHNQISRSYIEMLNRAEKDIIIMSSYFLPGRVIRRNLERAAKRGVKIRIILAGTSDVVFTKNGERFIYRWLLRNKMEIYEYPKCVLHGKISTYDGKWCTAGSYNVNNISAYASVELNLDVDNRAFAGSVQERLENIIKNDCVQVDESTYLTQYGIMQRFVQWGSYELIRFVFYLFTFYFRQKTVPTAK